MVNGMLFFLRMSGLCFIKTPSHSFSYVPYTESTLKSSQLILFQEDHEWNIPRLMRELGCGQLENVYLESGYGKYSARWGLSFSSTVKSIFVSFI